MNSVSLSRDRQVAAGRTARLVSLLCEQPRGLYLVSITEFWERFSYWGMLGLLVLFLTADPSSGGFGWSTSQAVTLYAIYTGAVFSAPAVGGYLAGKYFGERRCIFWGGLYVATGHLALAGPAVGPWLVEVSSGYPVGEWLRTCGIPLGHVVVPSEVSAAISASKCSVGAAGTDSLLAAYRLQAWTFLLGLVLIVAGTGFIKSTVSSIVGKLYAPGDRRRDEGFGIFMAFIYLGALMSNLVAGTLGELLDWHYGFAAAGVGMAIGLAWYSVRARATLGDIGIQPDEEAGRLDEPGRRLQPQEKGRIGVALLMSLFVVVYALAFYQKGGLLNLETKAHVDRTVFGFEIPATWLLSISTLVFILLTLPANRLWRRMAQKGSEPDVISKLALGLAALSAAYGLLWLGLMEKSTSSDDTFSIWWIVAMYALFGIGDLLVWPTQIAAVSRLVPPRFTAFAVGSWYLTIGFGSWLTGITGPIERTGGIELVAAVLLAGCGVCALIVAASRRKLMTLAGGRGAL